MIVIGLLEKGAPVVKGHWRRHFVKNTLLELQGKRGHGRGAGPIVSCTCDGERTNRDSESSDNGEYDDLNHRVSPFWSCMLVV